MKLLIAATILIAPAFADCCSYERVRAEARWARVEAVRQAGQYRTDVMRDAARALVQVRAEARRVRSEIVRKTARARVEARRAMRDARRDSYHDRRWCF